MGPSKECWTKIVQEREKCFSKRTKGSKMPTNLAKFRGNQIICLHCSGPLLENGLDRPKNCMVDVVFIVLQHFHIYHRGGWSHSLPLKIFFIALLGGGGDGGYSSVPTSCSNSAILSFTCPIVLHALLRIEKPTI